MADPSDELTVLEVVAQLRRDGFVGDAFAVEDAREMGLLLSAGPQIQKIQDILPKPTAAFTSALKARASTFSPSRMSRARRMLPSRLELNRCAGSARLAPRAKVSLTTCR